MNTTTTVYAICSPNLFCADNGAKCIMSSNCFSGSEPIRVALKKLTAAIEDDCGSDGICGGVDAVCNSQNPFRHSQDECVESQDAVDVEWC